MIYYTMENHDSALKKTARATDGHSRKQCVIALAQQTDNQFNKMMNDVRIRDETQVRDGTKH